MGVTEGARTGRAAKKVVEAAEEVDTCFRNDPDGNAFLAALHALADEVTEYLDGNAFLAALHALADEVTEYRALEGPK